MKKLLTTLLFAGLITSCMKERTTKAIARAYDGKDGASCQVESTPEGALLSCSDGSSVAILNGTNGQDGLNGLDGQDGVDGQDGLNGESCTLSGNTITCSGNTLTLNTGSSATLTDYSGSSCTRIGTTTVYTKKTSNFALYASSGCHSSSKLAEISQGEAYWVNSNMLATYAGSVLRVITF